MHHEDAHAEQWPNFQLTVAYLSENVTIAWYIVSSRVPALPWNIDLTPFYPPPPHPKKNSRTWLSPWNVPSSKKVKIHFLQKQKTSFPAMK